MSVNQTKTGFTLIEVLVSIMIISMATVAVMGAVQVNMKLSEDSEDDVIARFLAQDAVEYIQNIHDSKMIAYRNAGYDPTGIDWLGGLESCFTEDFSKGCKMDRGEGGDVSFSSCNTSTGCEKLDYAPPFWMVGLPWNSGAGWIDGGQYRYGSVPGSTVSKFTRDITIQDADTATPDVPTAIEAIVTVKVSWENRFGTTKDVTYEKSLFNWIKNGSVATVSVRSSSKNDSTGGSAVSVTAPSGTAVGDFVVVIVVGNGQNTIVDNNGSTPFAEDMNDYKPNPSNGHTLSIFSRTIQSGDPSIYNFTLGAGGRWSVIAMSFKNASGYDVAPNSSNATNIDNSASGTFTVPSITTLVDDAIHVTLSTWDTSATGAITTPAGYTLLQNANSGGEPLHASYKMRPTAGVTGTTQHVNTEYGARIGVSFSVK